MIFHTGEEGAQAALNMATVQINRGHFIFPVGPIQHLLIVLLNLE